MQNYKGLMFLVQIVLMVLMAYVSAWLMQSDDKAFQMMGGIMCLMVIGYFIFKMWPQGNAGTTAEALIKLHKQWGWFCTELGASILSYGLTKRGEGLHVYPGELLRTAFNEGWSMRGDNYELIEQGVHYRSVKTWDDENEAWFNSEVKDIVTQPETSPFIKIPVDDEMGYAQAMERARDRTRERVLSVDLDEPIDFSEEVMAAPKFVQIDDKTWINIDKVVSVFKYSEDQTQIMTEERYYIVNRNILEVLNELQGVQCSHGSCS